MAKKKAIKKIPRQPQEPQIVIAGAQCPKCGSTDLSGLMAAFWAGLMPDGGLKGQFSDYSSDTEIGPERLCADCGHEFEIE